MMQRRYRSILDLKINESAKALAFENSELACKLTSMGVLPGAVVELVRLSPFGHAYYIKVDGIRFALREEEASSILLEL